MLTVLYTQRIRGDLALLPRLYTFIQHLRAEHASGGRALLLDLGESCAPEVFPCALTGGRSTLIAFDTMGYEAANVDGALLPEDRARLEGMHLQIALVDAEHRLETDDFIVGLSGHAAETPLYIAIDPAAQTALDGERLHLAGVETGQVGMARLDLGERRLVAHGIFALPPDTRPAPTISGMIEMILAEARYTQKRRGTDA